MTNDINITKILLTEADLHSAKVIASDPTNYSNEDITAAKHKMKELKDKVDAAHKSLVQAERIKAQQMQLSLTDFKEFVSPNGERTVFGIEKKVSYSVKEGKLRRDAGIQVNASFNNPNLSDLFSINVSLQRQKTITKSKAGDPIASQYVTERVSEQLFIHDFNDSNIKGGDNNE